MHNRPIFETSLVAEVMDETAIHPELFKNCNKKFKYKPTRYIAN